MHINRGLLLGLLSFLRLLIIRLTLTGSDEPRKLSKTEMLERKFTHQLTTPNITVGNVSIVVIKQGPLHRTKLVENGKRQRKNWSSCHAVLTDTFLLFFKDAKTFAAMQG